jgi:hypothetical protein
VKINFRKGRDKFPALFCQASHGQIDKKFLRPKITIRNFYGFCGGGPVGARQASPYVPLPHIKSLFSLRSKGNNLF